MVLPSDEIVIQKDRIKVDLKYSWDKQNFLHDFFFQSYANNKHLPGKSYICITYFTYLHDGCVTNLCDNNNK